MDPGNLEKETIAGESRFLEFKHLPEGSVKNGHPMLNRYSSILTVGHEAPGAKVPPISFNCSRTVLT